MTFAGHRQPDCQYDIRGQIFRGVKVIRDTRKRSSSKHRIWDCRCLLCNAHHEVIQRDLKRHTWNVCPCAELAEQEKVWQAKIAAMDEERLRFATEREAHRKTATAFREQGYSLTKISKVMGRTLLYVKELLESPDAKKPHPRNRQPR
jgi:hypothetical protein